MSHNPNTPPPSNSGSGAQWFIIGALVVAVLVIGFFLFGGDVDPASDGGGNTSISVETGDTGTDSEDARPEADAAPGLEENTGVPSEGEATVEQ